ncbi:MAG TPA: hypothetical protein VMU47_06825 [Caldimonas sp.]|nr:hypothetical protein [Caldimonas sp.]
MASQTDIGNLTCTILGKPPISSLSEGSKRASVLQANYDLIRRKLLMGRPVWRFSVKRTTLAQTGVAPASGPYTATYNLPSDYIRALQVGDTYAGLDLSDYRMGPIDADYQIEGGQILCDYGSPLSLQYVYDVTNTAQFDPQFVVYFAAELAWWCCEAITESLDRQTAANDRKKQALSDAAASNALVRAPEHPADDTWILARLQ